MLGEPTLTAIARELVATVRRNVTIDWTIRENVHAQLRVLVKRILRKYGYPPDKAERATPLRSSSSAARAGCSIRAQPRVRRNGLNRLPSRWYAGS